MPRRHVGVLTELPEHEVAEVLAGLAQVCASLASSFGGAATVRKEVGGTGPVGDHLHFRVEVSGPH